MKTSNRSYSAEDRTLAAFSQIAGRILGRDSRLVGKRLKILSNTRFASICEMTNRHAAAFRSYSSIIRKFPSHLETYKRIDSLVFKKNTSVLPLNLNVQAPDIFCLFVGYPRSGHSLVGSLLDANRSITISHELDVLNALQSASFTEILRFIEYNSYIFAQIGRDWSGYTYYVPEQSQGLSREYKVAGDKKGGVTSRRLADNPELLEKLAKTVPCPIVFVHVIRNPYDNIATMALTSGYGVQEATLTYFGHVEAVRWLKTQWDPSHFIDIYLDDFISDPRGQLIRICKALNVNDVSRDYLNTCASIVFGRPKQTRNQAEWPISLLQGIARRCEQYSFLTRFVEDWKTVNSVRR